MARTGYKLFGMQYNDLQDCEIEIKIYNPNSCDVLEKANIFGFQQGYIIRLSDILRIEKDKQIKFLLDSINDKKESMIDIYIDSNPYKSKIVEAFMAKRIKQIATWLRTSTEKQDINICCDENRIDYIKNILM